ncbi:MAG: type II toxin-antitoxin system VapC family toxin [Pseudanabaena sp.]
MIPIVLLDTGVLGAVTNPKAKQSNNSACLEWLVELPSRGYEVAIPEIADYELRRELLLFKKFKGIQQLDSLKSEVVYLPITTVVMLKAAELWAQVRQDGKPTADSKALDGDVILAAQALLQAEQGYEVIIATTNVKHISRFVDARLWVDI